LGQRPFTRFRSLSKGQASRYNRQIVSVIFKSVKKTLEHNTGIALTVEAILPIVDETLKKDHIAVLKKDLVSIIIEVLDFFIEEGDIDIYDTFFEDVETELKKTLWPSVSKFNDPLILELLIDEIYNELDDKTNFTVMDLAERLNSAEALNILSFSELIEISEKALMKLEELHFIVNENG
jgi:hypothetical protein